MKDIKKHFNFLCNKIGRRVLGSKAEKKTAEYIEKEFKKYGLNTEIQKFSVEKNIFKSFELAKIKNGKKIKVNCIPLGLSPFTSESGMYLKLEYLENISKENLQRKNLKGKCVLLFNGFGENLTDFKNFMKSGVSGVILIDSRYPVDWPISLNIPYFWKKYLKIPVVSIPYFEAVKLKKEGIKKVFLKIEGKKEKGESENVMGFLKGTDDKNIVITSHHDSVLAGVGADDNGSGVIAVLKLAKYFSGKKLKRNLIFLSFGSEEVLSYGAFQFVKNNPELLKNTKLVINFDTFGSNFGESRIRITGNNSLFKYVKEKSKISSHYFKVIKNVSPYSDHYPFNIYNIPSLYIGRINCVSGFYHYHSKFDNLEVIDYKVISDTIEFFKKIIEEIASNKNLFFTSTISYKQKKKVEDYFKMLGIKWVLKSDL